MRSLRPAILITVGLGLSGCVGVNGGYDRQPYGSTFSGNSGFVTPYRYPNPSGRYLYDQSQRSWQGNAYRPGPTYRPPPPNYRPNPYYERSRSDNPRRNNPPGHDNPRGRGNGRDND